MEIKRETFNGREAPPSTTPPQVGSELRVQQQVSDALQSIPEGEKLDRYFGVTSGIPEQSIEEANGSAGLMQSLRDLSSGTTPLSDIMGQIAEHNETSNIDPDALRALMRGSSKKKG